MDVMDFLRISICVVYLRLINNMNRTGKIKMICVRLNHVFLSYPCEGRICRYQGGQNATNELLFYTASLKKRGVVDS
jgi:hypothetical protein